MLYDQSNTSFQNIVLEYCIYILSNESKFEKLPKEAGKFLNDLLKVCDGKNLFTIKNAELMKRIDVKSRTTFSKRRDDLIYWQDKNNCGLVGITQTGNTSNPSEGTEYSLKFLDVLKNTESRLKIRNINPESLRGALEILKSRRSIENSNNDHEVKRLINELQRDLYDLKPIPYIRRPASTAVSESNQYINNLKNKADKIRRNRLEPQYKIVKEKDHSSAKAFQEYTDASLQILRFEKRNIFSNLSQNESEKRLSELKKQIEDDLFEFIILAVNTKQIDDGVKWLSEFTLNISLSAKKISDQDNLE